MTHPSQPLCVADCGRPSPDAFLCVGCGRRLEKLLAELPAQIQELATTIAKLSRAGKGDSGKATKAAAQPLPLDLRTAHLADLVRNGIGSWVRHICEARGLQPPAIRETADMARWLLAHMESIRQDELAGELLTAMTLLARELNSAVDNHGRRYAGPCTTQLLAGDLLTTRDEYGQEVITVIAVQRECGTDLRVREGATTMTCTVCGREYSTAERMVWILAKTRDKLETGPAIADILTSTRQYGTVTWAMIRMMNFRGQIAHATTDDDGRQLFRIGDVLDVLDARATLRAERRGRMSA